MYMSVGDWADIERERWWLLSFKMGKSNDGVPQAVAFAVGKCQGVLAVLTKFRLCRVGSKS